MNFKKIQDFLSDLRVGEMKSKRAIFWYTGESPAHHLLNNIIRSCKHPAEIYYVQLFFKDVYKAVIELHESQNKEKDEKFD